MGFEGPWPQSAKRQAQGARQCRSEAAGSRRGNKASHGRCPVFAGLPAEACSADWHRSLATLEAQLDGLSLPMISFKHTRTTGKKLTYEVSIYPNRYVIALSGTVMKDASRPVVLGAGACDDEAARIFAIEDIEKLVGMDEGERP